MFARISNDFLDKSVDYTQFNSNIILDRYYNKERGGGSQFNAIINIAKFWNSHLKNIFTIKPVVSYAIFSGEGLVSPHTDGGNDSVALNFYIKVNNDATVFYEKKNSNVAPYPGTRGYDVANLNEIARFYAKPFDTYLVDVQVIHGIEKSTPDDRIFISYRWKNHSFEKIYNSLNVEKDMWKI